MTDRIESILAERGKSHGDFRAQFACAQEIKAALLSNSTINSVELTDVQKEVLDMIATKLSRIVCGSPGHQDHWDDIAGYAKLASKELESKP